MIVAPAHIVVAVMALVVEVRGVMRAPIGLGPLVRPGMPGMATIPIAIIVAISDAALLNPEGAGRLRAAWLPSGRRRAYCRTASAKVSLAFG